MLIEMVNSQLAHFFRSGNAWQSNLKAKVAECDCSGNYPNFLPASSGTGTGTGIATGNGTGDGTATGNATDS